MRVRGKKKGDEGEGKKERVGKKSNKNRIK
jgi:hypothetical protein